MNTSFLQELMGAIAERGRALIDRSGGRGSQGPESLESACRALLSGRGEASGVALARRVLDVYARASAAERLDFFRFLARDLGPDPERLRAAWVEHERQPSPASLQALLRAAEPPRQELLRRLNLAPGGTRALVAMREDLLKQGWAAEPELQAVDNDFIHLFGSWFNRGFLVLRRIDWSTPADILERLIRYEAVHEIQGWDDLRRRVQPPDRRCYGFFHPSLIDEPLIFVQVALTREIPASIQALLAEDRAVLPAEQATTAVFYSISNCQLGLRGISFGSFLIKQVVEELSRDLPALRTFVTLSPMPGFATWLKRALDDPAASGLEGVDLEPVRRPGWDRDEALKPLALALAAHYFLRARTDSGRPPDPVARFHLGNGARLERINWQADTSPKGLREGHGMMVNYLYDLRYIEANHEAFANEGTVVAASAVQRHLRDLHRKPAADTRHG